MPFRSEGEQIRERVRRIEEETRELLEEQAALERQAKLQEAAAGGRSLVALVAIVAVVATTFIGFETGSLETEKRAARTLEQLEREEIARFDAERTRMTECSRERDRTTTEAKACREDVAVLEHRLHLLSRPAPRDDAREHGF